MSDKTSTSEAAKPDPAQWVDEHGDVLYRFALLRVKDEHVAEDLVQETFISALQGLENFKGGSSVRTWLVGILKHKIIDHYRRKKNIVNVQDFIEDPDRIEAFFNAKGGWQKRPTHWSAHPGKAYQTREFLDHFYRCLSGLPKQTADVFVHREIDGLSTGEICNIFDITENNCWVILYRARMLLRKCLEMVGFNPYAERHQS